MSTEMTSSERARRVVDHYKRGTICAAEVWNQFVDHATAETFGEFMAQLTPELQIYFRQHVLVHRPAVWSMDIERQAWGWLSDYYETHAA